MPMWAIVVIPTVVALIVGYFAGREHLKYQVRNAVADAFTDRFQPNEEAKAEQSGQKQTVPQTLTIIPT
ncbi:MAG: hypothetical protein CMJ77_22490 [Planctomycetaceae bacterium]|nr:hypothetical protein [Planctomycetaceae bacterium]